MLNRKRVFWYNKAGIKHKKMTDTCVYTNFPVIIDVDEAEIVGSEEEIVVVGGDTDRCQLRFTTSGEQQQSFHTFLKAETAKLCKALKFSEDAVHMVQRLLDYPINNYDISKKDTHRLQAFQISLCWIAVDILGQKVDRKSLLLEAKEILNFECPENMADHVYNKLTPLIKTWRQEQLRKVKKHCEKRKLRLCRKHEEKVKEFNNVWKVKRDKLIEEHQSELAVFSVVVHNNPSVAKNNKLIEENNRFSTAIKDLECSMEWERRALEKKHIEETEAERIKREDWLAKADANYNGGQSTIIKSVDTHKSASDDVAPVVESDGVAPVVPANVETQIEPVSAKQLDQIEPVSAKQLDTVDVSLQNPKDFTVVNGQIVDEIPSTTERDTDVDSMLEDVPLTGKQSVLCPNPVVSLSPHVHNVSADLQTAVGPHETRTSVQSACAPNLVDESSAHKQLVIENGDDRGSIDHEPVINGTGHEHINKLSDSSRNHEVVAENGTELQNGYISNLVSNNADSWSSPSGSIDHEPLQKEIEKIYKEKEQVNKLHDDTKSQLKSELEKELEEMYAKISEKYTRTLGDKEKSFFVKRTEIEAEHNKVLMNRLLANAFRSKCRYFISSGTTDVVHQAGTPSFGQPSIVNPVYSAHRYPVFGLSSSSSSSRPPHIPAITPTIGNARVGGSNIRAPAPHLQPFKPPPSQQPQPVVVRISEQQPGPPRCNPRSFSAVKLTTNRNVNGSPVNTNL